MGRATKSYEVLCDTHGIQDGKVNYKHKSVAVGAPKNKRDRRDGGCPRCKTETLTKGAK